MSKYNAKALIEQYCLINGITSLEVKEYPKLRTWIENQVSMTMPYPLLVTRGNGGGQGYRILWLILNPDQNNNAICTFFGGAKIVQKYLKHKGHVALQDWLDNPHNRSIMPRTTITP